MDLIAIAEPIHILVRGGTLEQAAATEGALQVVVALAFLVPSTLIALGIGMTDWRETPLAQVLGFQPKADDSSWMERAADLDGDGTPDI
jgi:hypothetical protein